MWFKRVMLQKGDSPPPKAADHRPIDVYSLLVRILTSAMTRKILAWKKAVCHPSQHAIHEGLLMALTKLTIQAESALANAHRV